MKNIFDILNILQYFRLFTDRIPARHSPVLSDFYEIFRVCGQLLLGKPFKFGAFAQGVTELRELNFGSAIAPTRIFNAS